MTFPSAAVRWVAEWLGASWRLRVDEHSAVAAHRDRGQPLLFAVWHRSLLPPLWHRRQEGIVLLVSRHGDAEFLAAAAEQWGYQLVRGSTTRGGATAVRAVMRAVSAGRDAAMTPDGPRGPAHVVKPGLLWTARQTGAAIIPVGVAASSSTRLRSWDGFSIPRPGARVAVRYAAPIVPDWSDADDGARVVAAGLQHAEREAQCMV